MSWILTDTSIAEPLGEFPTLEALRAAAVRHMRMVVVPEGVDVPLELVLLYASFIYDEQNWVKDPFGSMLYCNCAPRLHKMDENPIGDLSFFAQPA